MVSLELQYLSVLIDNLMLKICNLKNIFKKIGKLPILLRMKFVYYDFMCFVKMRSLTSFYNLTSFHMILCTYSKISIESGCVSLIKAISGHAAYDISATLTLPPPLPRPLFRPLRPPLPDSRPLPPPPRPLARCPAVPSACSPSGSCAPRAGPWCPRAAATSSARAVCRAR